MGIMQKLETLVRGAAFTGVALASSLGMTYRANAEVIPADFFATTDAKKIELANYDSVVATSNWDDYYSTKIKWDDESKINIPIGYRVWVLDNDQKPSGLYDITTAGRYGFLHAYEDDSLTALIDEGANVGDVMGVLLEEISTGKMYNAQFVDSSYAPISVTFQGDKGRYSKDILVDTTPIIPEPSTLALILAGALTTGAGLGIRRKLKKQANDVPFSNSI